MKRAYLFSQGVFCLNLLSTFLKFLSALWLEYSLIPNTDPTLAEMDNLQALYREGVKLAEQELAMIKEEPNGVNPTLEILTALRSASEVDTNRAAAASVPFKSRNTKRKLDDTATSSAAESPTQSSNILSASVATPGGPAHARLKGGTGRSASVPVAPKEAKDTSTLKTDEALANAAGRRLTPRALEKLRLGAKT